MTYPVIIAIIFTLYGVFFLFFRLLEPAYVYFFKKPLFLHLHPFPSHLSAAERQFMETEFPFYKRLSSRRKKYFEHRVKLFVKRYEFVGNDIEITGGMRFLIAGTYVMLTFGIRNFLTPLFKKIVIYPDVYYSNYSEGYHKGEYNPRMKTVVFSWKHFIEGHKSNNDNINLGLHEFSHVLHFHAMRSNDASASIFYDEFNEILQYFTDNYRFREIMSRGYFRDYAFENQFEFLAVVLEHFFESPQEFKQHFPELYDRVKKMINFTE